MVVKGGQFMYCPSCGRLFLVHAAVGSQVVWHGACDRVLSYTPGVDEFDTCYMVGVSYFADKDRLELSRGQLGELGLV